MYPARPRVETKSQAELKLYHAFQEALPDDYVVFHSVAWLARDPRSGAQDGEADFVVAHPARGVLVVEVKGGRIIYDGATGRWYSNEHSIQDPFEQARGNKHSLLAKLKDLPYWRNRWLTIGHAVAFPDVVVKHDLRLDAPQEIILDARDLMALRSWLDAAFAYYTLKDSDRGILYVFYDDNQNIYGTAAACLPAWNATSSPSTAGTRNISTGRFCLSTAQSGSHRQEGRRAVNRW
jgi:hypothetical protein